MIRDVLNPTPSEKPPTITHIRPHNINVMKTSMGNMFSKFENDSTVAFAHTISGDLHCNRNMSAGVAVAFKNKFGRPKKTDYINTRLTLQVVESGANIYSLVTKNDYNGKPSSQEYDEAFEQLKEDFKNKNLKTLICSAMGCVRDCIEIEHFVKNIVHFQQSTKATVYIISHEQPAARRRLWRGLSHSDFFEKLQSSIAAEYGDATQPSCSLSQETTDVHLSTLKKNAQEGKNCSSPALQQNLLNHGVAPDHLESSCEESRSSLSVKKINVAE